MTIFDECFALLNLFVEIFLHAALSLQQYSVKNCKNDWQIHTKAYQNFINSIHNAFSAIEKTINHICVQSESIVCFETI